jgi:WD40 repeat protein
MFDPYHKWLGIPPGQRPPTYYQLLGVAPDEQDRDVILEAAIRQTAHLRTYQLGQHAAECSRLQNEIIRARDTLLNPAKRKAYDARLAPAAPPTAAPAPAAPVAAAPINEFSALAAPAGGDAPAVTDDLAIAPALVRSPLRRGRGRRWPIGLLVAIGIGLTVIAIVGDFLVIKGFFKREQASESNAANESTHREPAPRPAVRPEHRPEPPIPEPPRPVADRGDSVGVFEERIDLPPRTLVFSPDGRQVVSGAGTELWLWDVVTRQVVRRFEKPGGPVNQVAFSPDGHYLAAASGGQLPSGTTIKAHDCVLKVYEANNGKVVHVFEGEAPFYGVTFSADGRQLLAGTGYFQRGDNGQAIPMGCGIRLWDLDTGRERKDLPAAPQPVSQVVFGPGGRVFGGYISSPYIYAWDLKTNRLLSSLQLDSDLVLPIFSPDGSRVLVSGRDNTARLWTLDPLRNVQTIRPSTANGLFLSKAFSRDGHYALLGGQAPKVVDGQPTSDVTYKLWLVDLDKGKDLASLRGHTGPLSAVAFSADGRYAVTASEDRSIRLWDLGKYLPSTAPVKPQKVVDHSGAQPTEVVRVSVPGESDQRAAERLLRELFRDEYARRMPADKADLAAKLLQKGLETTDDRAARYVALREARDLAAEGGDLTTALAALEELAKGYTIDLFEAKIALLAAAAKAIETPAGNKALVEQYMELFDMALAAEKFDAATEVLSRAETAARRTQTLALVTRVQARAREIEQVRQEAEAATAALETLKQNPNDEQANETAGRYLSLRKGDWDKGLPLLARAKDPGLRAAAEKDVAHPTTGPARVAVADAWWDLAEAAKGWEKKPLQGRAGYWYHRALPDLAGLSLAKAEARVKTLAEQPTPFKLPQVVGEARCVVTYVSTVVNVGLSRDGSRMLSASDDGVVRITDASGKELTRLPYPPGQFHAAALSPDGRSVVTTSSAGLQLWEAKAGQGLDRTGDSSLGRLAFIDNQRLVTGGRRGAVVAWSIPDGSTLRRGPLVAARAEWGELRDVAVSPDGLWVAFVSAEGTAHLVSTVTRKELPRTRVQVLANCLTFTPDSRHVIVGGLDGALRLLDLTGRQLRIWQGHGGRVNGVAMSRDGNRIVSASDDKTVRLWDGRAPRELLRLQGHTDKVTCVALSADGRRAVSGSADRTARLWVLPN